MRRLLQATRGPHDMGLDQAVETRIRKAMDFEEPDRVPIWHAFINNAPVCDYFAPGASGLEMMAKVLHGLGSDLATGVSRPPESDSATNSRSSSEEIVAAGTRWRVRFEMESLEQLRTYDFQPKLLEEVQRDYGPALLRTREALEPWTMYVPTIDMCIKRIAFRRMSLELFCLALFEAPTEVDRLLEAANQEALREATVAAETKIAPIIFVNDEICGKGGSIFSPQWLRHHYFPRVEQVVSILRRAGMKVVFDLDGYSTDLAPDVLAVGCSGLFGIEQTAGNDIGELKRKYYGKLFLVGNVDCSHVLPYGTREQILEATKACLRIASPGGGHFIGCDGEITANTPLENVLTFNEAIHQHRKYPISC